MTRAERYQAAIAALSAVQTPLGLPDVPAAPLTRAERKRRALDRHAALTKATALLDPASRRRKRTVKAVENPVDIQ